MSKRVEAKSILNIAENSARVPNTKELETQKDGVEKRLTDIARTNNFSTATQDKKVAKQILEYLENEKQIEQLAQDFINQCKVSTGVSKCVKLTDMQLTNLEIVNENIQKKAIYAAKVIPKEKLNIDASSFIKKESYPDVKPPRLITQQNPRYLLELSKYTYPVKNQVLKKLAFYAPGRNGKEMTDFVMWKLRRSKRMIATDYSKFDGTQGQKMRTLFEKQFYKSFYPMYAKHLDELFQLDFDAKITMKSEEKLRYLQYYTMGARESGSGLTTDGNTINNAMSFYVSLRMTGLSHQKAWTIIENSAFYGDDAIVCVEISDIIVDQEALLNHLTLLGLDVKLMQSDMRCMPFLSRFFDWKTESSIPDPERYLPKIAIAYEHDPSNRSPEQQVGDRIFGYYINDPNDYVIRSLMQAIVLPWIADGTITFPNEMPHELVFKFNYEPWPASDTSYLYQKFYEKHNLPGPKGIIQMLQQGRTFFHNFKM